MLLPFQRQPSYLLDLVQVLGHVWRRASPQARIPGRWPRTSRWTPKRWTPSCREMTEKTRKERGRETEKRPRHWSGFLLSHVQTDFHGETWRQHVGVSSAAKDPPFLMVGESSSSLARPRFVLFPSTCTNYKHHMAMWQAQNKAAQPSWRTWSRAAAV